MTEIPTYSAINVQDNIGAVEDGETLAGSFSAAASPYWKSQQARDVVENKKGFSNAVAFCFTINYILGAGFLTIPWAFVQSGLMLSSIMLIISAIGSDIAKDFMLETMARAETMVDDNYHWKNNSTVEKNVRANERRVLLRPQKQREQLLRRLQEESDNESISIKDNNDNVNSKIKRNDDDCRDNDSIPIHKSRSLSSFQDDDAFKRERIPENSHRREVVVIRQNNTELNQKYVVEKRKFEVNALCRIFLGKRWVRIYTIVISLYMCGTLWAYTSVFASAMATAFPIFSDHEGKAISEIALRFVASSASLNYFCYAILFGCIVVPLSCLELDEQVPLQVMLTGCRFLMFFLMIGTAGMCSNDLALSSSATDASNKATNFRFAGVANTLPILMFANIFHHSIPGLTSPTKDKRKIGRVFTFTNLFTVVAYLILGLTLGSAFGNRIEQSSNLNWSTFNARMAHVDEHKDIVGAAWWTRAVSMYILIFPAIDVMSAYPLNAITLGNNLFSAAYGNRIHEVQSNNRLRIYFRIGASLPPIVLAIFISELGKITDYAGTTGFLIGLSFPAILYLSSKRIAKNRNFAVDTYYTNYGSSKGIAQCILWIGIFMVIGVILRLMFGG